MIGNDIIDLQQAGIESNWQRKGYLEKLFNNDELLLIKSHSNPKIMVWLLWSIKEASYKIANRSINKRFYAPLKFTCKRLEIMDENVISVVHFNKCNYLCQSIILPTYIHSVAQKEKNYLNNLPPVISRIYNDEFPIDPATYGLKCEEGIVKDNKGIPWIENTSLSQRRPISISHHGRFFAIAFYSEAFTF